MVVALARHGLTFDKVLANTINKDISIDACTSVATRVVGVDGVFATVMSAFCAFVNVVTIQFQNGFRSVPYSDAFEADVAFAAE